MGEEKEHREDHLLFKQDSMGRITLECQCGEVQQVEDLLHYNYLMSKMFGRIQGAVYTLSNLVRVLAFTRQHREHGEKNSHG